MILTLVLRAKERLRGSADVIIAEGMSDSGIGSIPFNLGRLRGVGQTIGFRRLSAGCGFAE
jgi:hypothetical protein